MTKRRPLDGYFFEDYAVGDVFHHPVPRTITEADASNYIMLVGARYALHCSKPLALAMGYRACPIDDMLVFNIAFGNTVADVSYNAIANLGYADVRFLGPVYAGDTISCESEVIGLKPSTKGRNGVVYVQSRALNQEGVEVLTWIRWVMVASRDEVTASNFTVPTLPLEVLDQDMRLPSFINVAPMDRRASGSTRRWEDYHPGTTINHPGGQTIGSSEHVLATRLYQNPARVHFDSLAARQSTYKRRLVYGGHVISICRSLSYFGLENAFAIAAIHGGTHTNPTFGNDTIYCRHIVTSRSQLPDRPDIGLLRMRMLGVKNQPLDHFKTPALDAKDDALVLDLDYSVFIPRHQTT
jgi:2-methylfumaryl-CoA hydratase